jgi:hypothetical protein
VYSGILTERFSFTPRVPKKLGQATDIRAKMGRCSEVMSERPLFDAVEELRCYREDLQRTTHATFDGILAQYVSLITPATSIGHILANELPAVDFERWWADSKLTLQGMVGSGRLAWPIERKTRLAMQRSLLLHMGDGKTDVNEFAYHFFASTSHRFDDYIRYFVNQVIEPFHRDLVGLLGPHMQSEKRQLAASSDEFGSKLRIAELPMFVAVSRIEAFRQLNGNVVYDLRKLIGLCEELNVAHSKGCWFSVAFLTRSLLDHVPPAFGYLSFAEVAGQYPGKSFKAAAVPLETFARKVADKHMHEPLSEHLALPNGTQVYAAPALDVVLGELERVLTQRASGNRAAAAATEIG